MQNLLWAISSELFHLSSIILRFLNHYSRCLWSQEWRGLKQMKLAFHPGCLLGRQCLRIFCWSQLIQRFRQDSRAGRLFVRRFLKLQGSRLRLDSALVPDNMLRSCHWRGLPSISRKIHSAIVGPPSCYVPWYPAHWAAVGGQRPPPLGLSCASWVSSLPAASFQSSLLALLFLMIGH